MSKDKKQLYFLPLIISTIITIIIGLFLLSLIDSDFIIACGIFAYLGNNPKKHFSWDKFNTLGMFNDNRGGDACGIEADGVVCHINDTHIVYYKDSLIKGLIHTADFNITDHIFGHTRKASSGGTRDRYTQPYYIEKNYALCKSRISKDPKYGKWSKLQPPHHKVFVGVHNGTIFNAEELAKKYKLKVIHQNDTQILFDLLFMGYFEVLGEYVGAASLIWYNYYEQCTYIFRGESPVTDKAITASEERPLYFWNIDKNNVYISSIEESLKFIGGGKDCDVKELPANTIFKIREGAIVDQINVDRSKVYQKKVEYSSYVPVKPVNKGAFHYNNRNLNNYDPYEDGYYEERNADLFASAHSENTLQRFMIIEHPSSTRLIPRLCLETSGFLYNHYEDRMIQYLKGRYWIGSNLAHGIFIVSPIGKIMKNTDTKDGSFRKLYYFIEGFRISKPEDYFLAQSIITEHEVTLFGKANYLISRDITDYEELLIDDIGPLSNEPYCSLFNYTDDELIISANDSIISPYTGIINAAFGRRRYHVIKGELSDIKDETSYIPSHQKVHHEQALRYARNKDSIFMEKITGDKDYTPTQPDLAGYNFYWGVDQEDPFNANMSFLSMVLNGYLTIVDADTLYPLGWSSKIQNTKTDIRNVTTALMVHFKTFNMKNTKCYHCSYRKDTSDICVKCIKNQRYILDYEQANKENS